MAANAICRAAVSQSRFRNCLYTGTLNVTVPIGVTTGDGVGLGVGVGVGVGVGCSMTSSEDGDGRGARVGWNRGDAATPMAPATSATIANMKRMVVRIRVEA